MSCVNLGMMQDALSDLVGSFGGLVDYYRETTTGYDVATGAVTKTGVPTYDVPALATGVGQKQEGPQLNVESDSAILVIAASDLPFTPTVNDRIEKPAASIRTSPTAYTSMRIEKIDRMEVGGEVFQYTLIMESA